MKAAEVPFDKLSDLLGLTIENIPLFTQALAHRSYRNEHKSFGKITNERLEFLGDAVLQLLTSEFLFTKFANEEEGKLTSYRASLVNTNSLADTARALGLGEYILMSKGEEASGGRDRDFILADVFESLLGAMYLQSGLEPIRGFLSDQIYGKIGEIIETGSFKDFKSAYQERSQERHGQTPTYEMLQDWGPDHQKTFKFAVFIGKTKKGEGEGNTKQKAQQMAAKEALEKEYGNNN